MGAAAVATLIACALLLGGGLLRRRHYRAFCRAPAARDDRIACHGDHTAVDLRMDGDGFDPPAGWARAGQTAFLALTVRATAVGALVDPFIEVRDGTRTFRQYFERGARGRRHLNLSPIYQDAGAPLARIRVRGFAITWRAEATLHLFDPPPLDGARLLVLAPHPDDAEIACFGLYADHPSSSWVVTVTAGEGGTADQLEVLPDPADHAPWSARLRVWNSLTIPRLGGVPGDRCLNLAYPDGALEAMWRAPTQSSHLGCEPGLTRAALRAENARPDFTSADRECRWPDLIDDLGRVLDAARPDVILAPHPTLDEHPDHLFTTVALDQALRARGLRPRLFLYAVHNLAARLFPFGPATAMAALPPTRDAELVADGLYSHPLSPERRLAKYFAVDANHDLRAHASGAPVAPGQRARTSKRQLSAFVAGLSPDPVAFQRRAPRPDEIYYLSDADTLSALVARALAARSAS